MLTVLFCATRYMALYLQIFCLGRWGKRTENQRERKQLMFEGEFVHAS